MPGRFESPLSDQVIVEIIYPGIILPIVENYDFVRLILVFAVNLVNVVGKIGGMRANTSSLA